MGSKRSHLRAVGLAGIWLLALIAGLVPSAAAQAVPDLSIDQIKITADNQFVTLNNSGAVPADLGAYELVYFNAEGKPSKTFTFTGTMGPGGYYMLSDGLASVCWQMQIEAISLGFSTTGGSLQLWHYASPSVKNLISSVAWVKTRKADTPAAALTLPSQPEAFLQRQISGEWIAVQPNAADPCVLESSTEPTTNETDELLLLPGAMPPVRFVSSVLGTSTVNRNHGKMAPVINELLPNPASPQTDADNEFIELYNPNDSGFDLSGFKLAFGSTNPKKYTFPEGTMLEPKSFKAFTSEDTSISLSNDTAQVWLLDPNEKIIGQTEPYQNAKDGQAWALNNGAWVWTLQPSPNAMNTLAAAANSAGKSTAAVLGITSGTGSAELSGAANPASAAAGQLDDAAPLHPAVLAGVGISAVGYALYEYRPDLANRYQQLRRYFRTRKALRPKS